MIHKLLIANRGEIACRIIKTAQNMGISTVAIYSDADKAALHVKSANEAVHLGPAESGRSYLVIDKIIEAAKASGAEAIHPGYGFLSENAQFAEEIQRNNLIFIGPPVSAITAMGAKDEAKKIMQAAGVPVVPGYHGENQDIEFLRQQAESIGFPLLIKAVAGGGGKGMRRVEQIADFRDALESAKREAAKSFNNDRVILERYLSKPKHIEMQVFADRHGNVVHLFERDCSIQRRYQKVIEEAPSTFLDEFRRRQMGDAAKAAAIAIDYVGAGTVEFIVDASGEFYFMEMNTRLQVEHPVTEMITGCDLVEWQIKVAAGEALPLSQEQIDCSGHAIEVRLYAEDPQNQFLPSVGRLQLLELPRETSYARVDSGVTAGDEVSSYYDPMIAKVIVWGDNRMLAINHLRQALSESVITGVKNNLRYLQQIINHDRFIEGQYDTGFVDRYGKDLENRTVAVSAKAIALASMVFIDLINERARNQASQSTDPYSPWNSCTGWRLNEFGHQTLRLQHDAEVLDATVTHYDEHLLVQSELGEHKIRRSHWNNDKLVSVIDDEMHMNRILFDADSVTLSLDNQWLTLSHLDPVAGADDSEHDPGTLNAPMPGKVIKLLVAKGDHVDQRQALLIVEAMKMEHTITAPKAGIVGKLHFREGDLIDEGVQLLSIDEA